MSLKDMFTHISMLSLNGRLLNIVTVIISRNHPNTGTYHDIIPQTTSLLKADSVYPGMFDVAFYFLILAVSIWPSSVFLPATFSTLLPAE